MSDSPELDQSPHDDLGQRSFAGQNVAADHRHQAAERGGHGAEPGDADDTSQAPLTDTRGLERDGNGDPLGGMTPEDDMD